MTTLVLRLVDARLVGPQWWIWFAGARRTTYVGHRPTIKAAADQAVQAALRDWRE